MDDVDVEAAIAAAGIARAAGVPSTSDIEAVRERTDALVDAVSIPIFAEHVPPALTREQDLERALRALRRRHDGLLCVTLGPRGASLLDGDRFVHQAAFDVHAVDYLLKPFDKKRVMQSVERARSMSEVPSSSSDKLDTLMRMLESQKTQTSKILLKAAGRLFLVSEKDICIASIEDGIITVVTGGPNGMEGQSNCRTLEELLDSLDPNLFWRAHRSYLVNTNRIREVVPWFKSSYQLRMDDKKQTEIPVSRAQTKRLRELFGL